MEQQKEKNLTLNGEQYKFHMTELVFMGLILTNKGIGRTEEKVKAVVEAREPQNTSEVRSFLGLANYNEPLRK